MYMYMLEIPVHVDVHKSISHFLRINWLAHDLLYIHTLVTRLGGTSDTEFAIHVHVLYICACM